MDSDVPGPSGPELKEYTALLRRRWHLVGAGVLGGLVLATAGLFAVPSTYTSVAAVQVHPTGMAEFTGERSGRLTGDVNLDSEAQVAVSDQVTRGMAEELPGAPSPADLRERIDVTVPSNSNILELHYSARSPEAARDGADALAAAYLEHRGEQARTLINGRLDALREEQEGLYERLSELASEGSESAQVSAEAQADALRQEISDLGNGISPLSALLETVSPGQVISPAELPESPSSPVPLLWLVAGAALGLIAGLLAAVVRDRLDPRVHDTEDTARVGAVPVLLDLSATRADRSAPSPGLLTDADPVGQRANEFAHLVRARLTDAVPVAAATGDDTDDRPAPGHVLVVAGTTPGRAGTAAAVNLAAALARTGSETLLVCADPRGGTAEELLDLPEGPGLAEVLVDGEDPADLEARPTAVPRLRVLRHGRPGAAAPVQGGAAELVELLRPRAAFVVVVTAAVVESADAHALAASADLLLPVVELGRTRRAELTGLVAAGARFGVTVPGAVTVPRQPNPAAASRSRKSDEAPKRANEAPTDTGTADIAEATGAAEATETARVAGSTEPATAAETSDTAETAGAADPSTSAGTTGVAGATEATESAEVTESTEAAEATEVAQSTGATKATEATDSSEPSESAEGSESSEADDASEVPAGSNGTKPAKGKSTSAKKKSTKHRPAPAGSRP
ncbi:chain length determinant family protein [Nocardiopsis sp. B62]|uniref:chain length determinant family protein n=1 Tax=Nocardiopsis sp. B62 TaxID=2824874 RepID=UPI001B3709AA|nr:chain length determinant family protein [Nocardiopsis sp. B62]MBQ1084614.1 chain length determinant family protein [Nocardiopsis sp. B62]